MSSVKIEDKIFDDYLSEEEIKAAIHEVALAINRDYEGKDTLFLGILNGAFMFASDLLKEIELPCEISFVKLSSYQGTNSTGQVHELIGVKTDISNKHVVVLEDIVDSGLTLQKIYSMLQARNPQSIAVASLLFKPDAFEGDIPPQYVGKEIPNDFIVGYGLDYNQKGRNLRNIYKIREN